MALRLEIFGAAGEPLYPAMREQSAFLSRKLNPLNHALVNGPRRRNGWELRPFTTRVPASFLDERSTALKHVGYR